MKKKMVFIVIGCVIAIIIAGMIIGYYNFKNSYRYTQYQLYLATKKSDSTIAMKYYDIDKIVDNKISDIISSEMQNNPFAALGVAIVENMRPALIKNVEKQISDSYDNHGNDNMPCKLKLFWYAYTNTPVNPNFKFEFKKINDKKIKITAIERMENTQTTFTMQKIEKRWVITAID